ncbi:MAG: phosphatase PAP2 family protein [Bacteroidia bacterium]|nr:phosphatase PAP2 family protein [Bacteroidia bacterium]
MEWLLEADYSILLFLNGLHSPFFDWLMMLLTAPEPWIPLYFAIASFIVYYYGYKKGDYKYSFALIAGAILTFALTDMGSSAIKDYFERLRPGHDPRLEGLVRLLDGKGGMYGFISSHASNVFGLATITSLAFRKRWYSATILIWAAGVSYSRIYVGRHFPSDVVAGALFGFFAGLIFYKLVSHFFLKSKIKCTT